MAYNDGFEIINMPEDEMSEVQRVIISGFIKEGEFKTREFLIKTLEEELKNYPSDSEWAEGIGYAIQVIREVKVEDV